MRNDIYLTLRLLIHVLYHSKVCRFQCTDITNILLDLFLNTFFFWCCCNGIYNFQFPIVANIIEINLIFCHAFNWCMSLLLKWISQYIVRYYLVLFNLTTFASWLDCLDYLHLMLLLIWLGFKSTTIYLFSIGPICDISYFHIYTNLCLFSGI